MTLKNAAFEERLEYLLWLWNRTLTETVGARIRQMITELADLPSDTSADDLIEWIDTKHNDIDLKARTKARDGKEEWICTVSQLEKELSSPTDLR